MTTANLSLNEQHQQEQDEAIAAYRKLVAESVDLSPKLSAVRPILKAVDKTIDDFNSDVAVLRSRLAAAAGIAEAGTLDPAIAAAMNDFTKAHQLIVDIEDRHRKELEEARQHRGNLAHAERELQKRQFRLRSEGYTLLKNTASAEIDQEIANLAFDRDEADQELHQLMSDLQNFERIREAEKERHEAVYGDTVPLPGPSKRHEYLIYRTKQLEAVISDAKERIEELDKSKLNPVNQRWS